MLTFANIQKGTLVLFLFFKKGGNSELKFLFSTVHFLFSTVQNGAFFIFNGATFFETIVAVGI